jgi:hypothetical protein
MRDTQGRFFLIAVFDPAVSLRVAARYSLYVVVRVLGDQRVMCQENDVHVKVGVLIS